MEKKNKKRRSAKKQTGLDKIILHAQKIVF